MIRILLCLFVFVCYSFNAGAVVLQSPSKAFSYNNTIRKNKTSVTTTKPSKPAAQVKKSDLTSSTQDTVFVKKDFFVEVYLKADSCCYWKVGNSSSAVLTSDIERDDKKILKFRIVSEPRGEIYFDQIERSTGNPLQTKQLYIQSY